MFNPVPGSRVSSGYKGGYRKHGGHSGIDFAAPMGSEILAVVGGRVISVDNRGAYGNTVRVQHEDGTIGLYAHMSRYGVRVGQQVARGSVLGYVGSTGNSTGPHLHFSIYQNGSPINPTPWLEGSGAYDGNGSMMGDPFAGYPSQTQMPDIVQYRNPQEVLAAFQAAAFGGRSTGTAGGGFVDSPTVMNQPGVVDMISQGGIGDWLNREAFLTQQRMNSALQDDMMAMVHQQPPGQMAQPGYYGGNGGQGDFDRLVSAIADKESGGNYSARNSSSGALGRYQIMPANIPSWSKAALGRTVTTTEFLNSPQIQDQVARHRLNYYYQKYGAAGAALAWYAGEGALKYSNATRNRPQGAYPSMNSYVQDVLRRAGL